MNVHDLIFTVGLIATALFLVPMIRGPFKPPLTTSIPMAIILAIFGINFYSLGLWVSCELEVINVAGWAILIAQKAYSNK